MSAESNVMDFSGIASNELEQARLESAPHLGEWNRLISRTNWEKGAIICRWRKEVREAGRNGESASDELWSRLAGGVSPQHVGRLRRTWERFGNSWQSFPGLYWSHFYAALDWDDAEMWLEGAMREGWSVSAMRLQRWEATGGDPSSRPDEQRGESEAGEIAEESQSLVMEDLPVRRGDQFQSQPLDEGPDFGMESPASQQQETWVAPLDDAPRRPAVALFPDLAGLPADIVEVVEEFQLCIIRHRNDAWKQVARSRVVDLLTALQRLAESDGEAHGAETQADSAPF